MTLRYKKLCTIFIISVIAFILGHYAIWKSVTEVLLSSKYDGGDLARMGYPGQPSHPEQTSGTQGLLPKAVLDQARAQLEEAQKAINSLKNLLAMPAR